MGESLMDALQRGMITLIRSGITGERLELPEDFDLEQVYPELLRHQIQPLGYLGAVQCGLQKDMPVMRKLFQSYCRCIGHSEGQLNMVKRVCAAFDHTGVDYMPLKGCNLKGLYPKPELRLMGDADILIRTEQYQQIRPILLELGFAEQLESDHELIWDSDALHLELHKRLIPSYNKDYYRYFGDGWNLAKVQCGCRFEMEKEDELIYLFTHFAKHYRDGGIGCRHIVDLWVYRRACPQLDEEYICRELDKLQLLEFYQNILSVLRVWFEDGAGDEKTDFITDFIFNSGSWGQHSAHILSAVVKERKETKTLLQARIGRMLHLAFIPYYKMKQRYPCLIRFPILLPFFWIIRIIDILFLTPGKMQRHSREFLYANEEKTSAYQQSLHYVGLDFHFKE